MKVFTGSIVHVTVGEGQILSALTVFGDDVLEGSFSTGDPVAVIPLGNGVYDALIALAFYEECKEKEVTA